MFDISASSHWTKIFIPDSMKIDKKYVNVWLEDVPNLAAECSRMEISDLVGENFEVGGETVFTEYSLLEFAAVLFSPKNFAETFSLRSSGGVVSTVFLREDFITLWNGLVDDQDTRKLNVLSAAHGLGKSIYLYLIAVFARHFGIPVQYIGNVGDLLRPLFDETFIASRFAAMLLFMNLKILDELGPFYPQSSDYEHLRSCPMKVAIFYALAKGYLALCGEIRRKIMSMAPRNFIIIEDNDTLWQKLGSDPKKWTPFFEFYAHPVRYGTWYCKFVFAGSQHHEFESNLPSGYEFSIQYLEPLSPEEFAAWENLSDYPNIKDKKNEVACLTGLVPRMIGRLVILASNSGGDFIFEEFAQNFKAEISYRMKRSHSEYVDSLNDSKKADFAEMLYKLFVGRETPRITICDNAYRHRGLLITFKDRSLQFYNSVARDILFDTFMELYFSLNRPIEVSQRLKETRRKGAGGDEYFQKLFLALFCPSYREFQTYSRVGGRTIHFESEVLFRFDGKYLDRRLSSISMSCWIQFIRNYPRLDYAYVDMTDGKWMLYLIQVSVLPFSVHNRGSAQLELLFEKSGESVPLASLLSSFFGETFEVSPVYNARKKIVDFEVIDSEGTSCRERISFLYVTLLTREDVKADSAPKFVEFLTFDNFPDNLKHFIDIGQKVRSGRRPRSRRSLKRTESEKT